MVYNGECMVVLDSNDLYVIGKYYTELYNWTYTDDELWALSEYYVYGDNLIYDFNVKLIFEDHNCIISKEVIEKYETDDKYSKFISDNDMILYYEI